MATVARFTAGGNVVLGCWLIAAPFVFGTPAISRWTDVLVGLTVALVAGYNYDRARRRRPLSAIGAVLVTVLGLWLIVEPFVFGLEGPHLWHDVVWGTIVAGLGSYSAYIATITGRTPSYQSAIE